MVSNEILRPVLLPKSEANLLRQINRGMSSEVLARFDHLASKQLDIGLTIAEREEYIDLCDIVEEFQANRLKRLGKLARLRKVSLQELMKELDIRPRPNEPI